MATPILKVITEFCFPKISDDIELEELINTDRPLFARKCWGYLKTALPKFNIPDEMQDIIYGSPFEPKLVEPKYDNAEFTTGTDLTSDYDIELGETFAGYELVSVRQREVTYNYEVVYHPASFEYNPETGTVTLHASEEQPIPAGAVFDLDFYKDGDFKNDLTPAMCEIIGLLWEYERLSHILTSALDITPTVDDKSFSVQNRANKETADRGLLLAKRNNLISEMTLFAQNSAARASKSGNWKPF